MKFTRNEAIALRKNVSMLRNKAAILFDYSKRIWNKDMFLSYDFRLKAEALENEATQILIETENSVEGTNG